jgi:hypothetical protein
MKTYIYPFLLLIGLLASCKDDVSLPEAGNEAKIVVYCFPSTRDTTYISVSRSLPVKQYKEGMRIKNIDDARLIYTVNGQQREVTNRGNGIYYVVGKQKTGDKIALTVSADSLPTASAETSIPDTIAISDPKSRQTKVYDDDREEMLGYEQVMASFTDPSTTKDYYAVRVLLKNIEYSEDDSLYDERFYYPIINTKNEPILVSKTNIDDAFGFSDNYYGGLCIFDDAGISGKYTFHLNVDNKNDFWWNNYNDTKKYERVELLHLTPEYYKFLFSINAEENSDLAQYGLSQLMPTATNVNGGLGVVAGWNVSHTAWIKSKIDNDDE